MRVTAPTASMSMPTSELGGYTPPPHTILSTSLSYILDGVEMTDRVEVSDLSVMLGRSPCPY